MDRKLNIIPGEAPESDDEENAVLSVSPNGTNQSPCLGVAVTGEAPESDSSSSSMIDEAENVFQKEFLKDSSAQSLSSATSALSTVSAGSDLKVAQANNLNREPRHGSLLHKKLRERNAFLRKGLEDFIHQTIDVATRDLNSIDQHLLKSQVTLQEAASSLRLLQSNLSHIHSKLTLATSTSFPAINTEVLLL